MSKFNGDLNVILILKYPVVLNQKLAKYFKKVPDAFSRFCKSKIAKTFKTAKCPALIPNENLLIQILNTLQI